MTAKIFKTGDIPAAGDFNEFTQNSNANITGGTINNVDVDDITGHLLNSGNPHGTTKTQVGLGNVDNTSDANKPVSTAQQAALDLKANAASPTTTGTLTHSGDIVLSGAGKRITGDFSNDTIANRVMFQTSTVNGQTSIGVLPNGTNTFANLNLFGGSDPANASIGQLVNTGTEVRLGAVVTGSGTYLPMTFYTGGSERVRIDTNGSTIHKMSLATAITDYVADFQSSGSVTNAGRCIWSQNSTYALALALNNSGTTSANAHFQWIQRSDGALQSTPLRLQYDGQVLAIAPAGLGYGTGAGGTVIQATSKWTAVTLNKPSGKITMNNAALGAGASVAFNLSNSLISGDNIVVSPVWPAQSDAYTVQVTHVGSGFATLRVTNISAVSRTDALDIKFEIIKGATA